MAIGRYLLTGGLMLLALLAGCGRGEAIRIGFSGNLSGGAAHLGIDARNGTLLAVEEINAGGGIRGRPLELLVKDDQGDPATARRVDRELIDAGAVAIVGHVISSMTDAVLPMMNEKKVLLISPTSVSDIFTGKDDYLIRLSPSARDVTRRFAYFSRLRIGVRKIAILYDSSNKAYSEDWVKNFKEAFEDGGGRIAAIHSFVPEGDLEWHTKRLLETRPDGIAIVASGAHSARISQEIRKIDHDIPLFIAGWGMTDELLKLGGAAVEGAHFSYSFDRTSTAKPYLEFREKYAQRFGQPPDFAGKFAYESVQVLAQALENVSAPNGTNLKKAIIGQSDFSGLQGNFKFDAFGDVVAGTYIFTIRNGAYTRIE